MLRRTQEVMSKHLPPLSVHTLFCKPSALQVEVYRALLRSQGITSLLYGRGSGDGDGCSVLPAITVLKKLCNHPALLHAEGVAGALQQQPPPPQQQQAPGQRQQQLLAELKVSEVAAAILEQHAPGAGLLLSAPELSGKLLALSALLAGVIAEGGRVVVVSTSTSALDLIDQVLCGPAG
jgi:SNF2 family DNA or RNA helicase